MTAEITEFDRDDLVDCIKRVFAFTNMLKEQGYSELVIMYALSAANAELDAGVMESIFDLIPID